MTDTMDISAPFRFWFQQQENWDLKYLWKSQYGIWDFSIDIADEEKLNLWYTVRFEENELVYYINETVEAILLERKKAECQSLILSHYSISDQLNILRSWTPEELQAMKDWIDPIMLEMTTNGIDADFTPFYT